jgi:hypothetical protein
MAHRNDLLRFGKRWTYEEAVQRVAQAFRHARRSLRATIAQLAKWCGRSKRTIAYWLSGEKPLELARVCKNPRLRRHFLRCFSAIDRSEWKEAA